MKTATKRIFANLAYAVGTVIALTLVWWAIAAALGNDLVLPTPWASLAAGWDLLGLPKFWRSFGMTLLRTLGAFAVSAALAFAAAAAARVKTPARKICNVLASILRALPTVAVVLILLLWVSPRVAPAIVSAVVIAPMLYGSFLASFDAADPRLLEMARVYGVSKRRQLFGLVLPSALPIMLPALGNHLSLTLKLMVAAEVLANTAASLGGLMQEASAFYLMPRLYALVLVTIALALILEGMTALLTKRAVKWL